MATPARYTVITPYYREDRTLLERCIRSVHGQSVKADHILIADGYPQAWIDNESVRHLKLDRPHNDFGNTPRGIGALLAVAEEYDGICLLDADNWFDADHVEVCLESAARTNGGVEQCDYIIARRTFRRPDETIMPITEAREHVDTSCLFFLRGSFAVISRWATMPKAMSPICDRFFFRMLRTLPFRHVMTPKPTVNYHCTWQALYLALNETPPEGAKPNVDSGIIQTWLDSLTVREWEIACRLSGLNLTRSPLVHRPGSPGLACPADRVV
jgi:hypothetical protein